MECRRLLIALILSVLGVPGLALASQLAVVSEINTQNNDYILTDPGISAADGGIETLTASSEVELSFNTALNSGLPSNIDATLTLTAQTTTSGILIGGPGGEEYQPGFSGTFSIVSGLYGDLLSGTFTTASITGGDGGSAMTFSVSDSGVNNQVTFASQIINFSAYSGTEALSFALTNLTPALALDASDSFLASTTGAGVDTFSANPLPPVVTPEPRTLVLSGAALLGIGLALRKRKLLRVL